MECRRFADPLGVMDGLAPREGYPGGRGGVFPACVAALLLWLTAPVQAQHNHAQGHPDYQHWVNKVGRECCNGQDCGELRAGRAHDGDGRDRGPRRRKMVPDQAASLSPDGQRAELEHKPRLRAEGCAVADHAGLRPAVVLSAEAGDWSPIAGGTARGACSVRCHRATARAAPARAAVRRSPRSRRRPALRCNPGCAPCHSGSSECRSSIRLTRGRPAHATIGVSIGVETSFASARP